jgi:hypothetical protein
MAIDGRSAVGTAAPTTPQDLPKPKLPGFKEVVDQLIRDLFGKDVQDTVTFSYEWTADQFGHLALGFELTFVLTWIARVLGYRAQRAGFVIGVAVVLGFVVKEADDFRRAWLKSREARSIFRFNGWELFLNTFTAVYYIAIGALVASLGLWEPAYGLVALAVSVPFVVGMACAWLRRKITFQQAGLPYLYRLANFPNTVDRPTAEFIVSMARPAAPTDPPATADHLILAGPLASGKTSLVVGLASEFAIRMGIGRYTTLAKLLQSALRGEPWDRPEFDDGRILWPWQTSELLVVDDVDALSDHTPGTPTEARTQRRIAQSRVNTLKEQIPQILQAALKFRRTVWVVGDVDDGELQEWRAMIADVIGVDPSMVRTFRFARKLSELPPDRKALPREMQVSS